MKYIEMSIEEAIKLCNKHTKVLVAIQDLTQENNEVLRFEKKRKEEYDQIFSDVKTVVPTIDDFIKRLDCFTVKQNIMDVQPVGMKKIVLIK